jgi:hypothetical protein
MAESAPPTVESALNATSPARKGKQISEDQGCNLGPKEHIKRAVDKLGRSLSARVSSNPKASTEGHRRILSLSRKEKAKARPKDLHLGAYLPAQPLHFSTF